MCGGESDMDNITLNAKGHYMATEDENHIEAD